MSILKAMLKDVGYKTPNQLKEEFILSYLKCDSNKANFRKILKKVNKAAVNNNLTCTIINDSWNKEFKVGQAEAKILQALGFHAIFHAENESAFPGEEVRMCFTIKVYFTSPEKKKEIARHNNNNGGGSRGGGDDGFVDGLMLGSLFF